LMAVCFVCCCCFCFDKVGLKKFQCGNHGAYLLRKWHHASICLLRGSTSDVPVKSDHVAELDAFCLLVLWPQRGPATSLPAEPQKAGRLRARCRPRLPRPRQRR
jgi:hypothetical protein